MTSLARPEPEARPSRTGPIAALALAVILAFAIAYLGTGSAYVIAGALVVVMLVLTVLRPLWSVYFFLGVVMLLREYGMSGTSRVAGTHTVYDLGIPVGFTIYFFDLLLLAALAGLLLRSYWKQEPLHVAPESVPLLIFIALGPIFAVWGMANGSKFLNAATDYRVAYRSAFIYLLAITALRDRRAGVICGVIVLAGGVLRLMWGDVRFVLHHGETYSLAGLPVAVPFIEQADAQIAALVGICAMAYLLWSPGRMKARQFVLGALLFLAASATTVLTLRRSAWLTLAVGVLVVALFAIRQRRTWYVGLAMLLALGSFMLIGGERAKKLIDLGKIAGRLTSALGDSGGTATGPTSESLHYGELKDAVTNIQAHPILGWGLGHELVREASSALTSDVAGRLMRVHDVYLDIWVKMGLVGLSVFLWWVIASTVRMLRATRRFYREQRPLAWLYGGLAATWAGWLFAGMGTTMIFGGNRIGIMFFGTAAVLLCWEYYEGKNSESRRQEIE